MNILAPKIKPEFADELMKLVKDPKELWGPEGLFQELKKALVERMLEAEMDTHLGYDKGDKSEEGRRPNSRNGHSDKTVRTESGPMDVRVPRDRDGSFTPRVIPKNARRLEGFDAKVLSLYARGMTTREIQSHLQELYGTEVSPQLISEVTDAVLEQAAIWQSRPLESIYPIVYLDALFVAVREGTSVQKKPIYVALGVSTKGHREVLGLWFAEAQEPKDGTPKEGAKFWLSVLTDLKNRGVQDIFFVCCDGLTGLPKAIETAFPLAIVQTCIVHMIRASLRYVAWVDRKLLVRDLRPIYGAATVADAERALDAFDARWSAKYPAVAKMWRTRWNEVVPFLDFPGPIRKILYTTNAIESLNFQFRKVLNPRGHFPSDAAVRKVLFLAIQNQKSKGKPTKEWGLALAHFHVLFADRLPA